MAPYVEDIDEIRAQIDQALAAGHIDDWQRQFLVGVRAKIDRYGRKTRLSEKQINKLREVIEMPVLASTRQGPWTIAQRKASYVPSRRHPKSKPAPAMKGRRWGIVRRPIALFVVCAAISGVVTAYFYDRLVNVGGFSPGIGSPLSSATEHRMGALLDVCGQDQSADNCVSVRVIDGDTLGFHDGRANARLVGFDTPETFEPQCVHERKLGEEATNRLRELINGGGVELQYVRCSCRPGTQGTDACNYGRDCARLLAGGRDVGTILISEGLAARYVCGATGCPPRRNWC
jgi:micrococcal nuclease